MKSIIAKCGYRCDLCPAYETNLTSEQDKQDFSLALERYYDCRIAPEAIKSCKGCLSADKQPDPDCSVYPCVTDKGLGNCGQCADFGCDKLKQRMDIVEEYLAKAGAVSSEDFRRYFQPFLSRDTLTQIHDARP
ncbi:MAG: DUF3795 domain-containing protein [Sedimentisphaerales bacterium]|nr:DUF3795 domain-containing protein [Sedimentisphaerales bacterium]